MRNRGGKVLSKAITEQITSTVQGELLSAMTSKLSSMAIICAVQEMKENRCYCTATDIASGKLQTRVEIYADKKELSCSW